MIDLRLTKNERETLLTLLEPSDPSEENEALYDKIRAAPARKRGKRCVHCGRLVQQVTTDRGELLGPITYWTHTSRHGNFTDCGLLAEVES